MRGCAWKCEQHFVCFTSQPGGQQVGDVKDTACCVQNEQQSLAKRVEQIHIYTKDERFEQDLDTFGDLRTRGNARSSAKLQSHFLAN
jgi:hypothetical protein